MGLDWALSIARFFFGELVTLIQVGSWSVKCYREYACMLLYKAENGSIQINIKISVTLNFHFFLVF